MKCHDVLCICVCGCCAPFEPFLVSVIGIVIGLVTGQLIVIIIAAVVFVISIVIAFIGFKDLEKHVLDLSVPENRMVIEHIRLPVYCCLKKKKFIIGPLSEIVEFNYQSSPLYSDSQADAEKVIIKMRSGLNFSFFEFPLQDIRRVEVILKQVNRTMINKFQQTADSDGSNENDSQRFSSQQHVQQSPQNLGVVPSYSNAPNFQGFAVAPTYPPVPVQYPPPPDYLGLDYPPPPPDKGDFEYPSPPS